MKLSSLNEWLTLLANVGVLAGILFLAFEIQQNTSAIQSSTAQSVTGISSDSLGELAANPVLAGIRLKGDSNPVSLSDLEALQYFALNRGFWITFQNVFFQLELGTIQPNVWAGYYRIICDDFTYRPGLRSTWDEHADVLDPGFVSVVESCSSF